MGAALSSTTPFRCVADMQRYSLFSLVRQGLRNHSGWREQWRAAAPKSHYYAIVNGGGGHGLGAAVNLARDYGRTNIAGILHVVQQHVQAVVPGRRVRADDEIRAVLEQRGRTAEADRVGDGGRAGRGAGSPGRQ